MTAKNNEKIAIILIRGLVKIRYDIKDTLKMLGLHRKFACTIRPKTPELMGMLRKVKDYVTWGPIDEETHKELVDKRGLKNSSGELKKFFRLHPPKGGFEKKGTKRSYSEKGALGNRGKDINNLIKRMI
ncbi:MAG: uL30 family ribosomal protein [Candidatus Nanoarchaeia archaeon]